MKIVVDSNIVFSAILNTQSRIGQLIINGSKYFDFYTVDLLKTEILKHKGKIIKFSKYNETHFFEVFELIVSRIKFLNDILITDNELSTAINLVANIDENDALFVALNNRLSGFLWTGDKRLINGLRKKDYQNLITTDELFEIFLKKQSLNFRL